MRPRASTATRRSRERPTGHPPSAPRGILRLAWIAWLTVLPGVGFVPSLEAATLPLGPVLPTNAVVATGLALSGLHAAPAGDSLAIRIHAERQGSAAYIGTARGALRDAAGKVVGSFSEPVAIYYQAEPTFAIARQGLPAGRYQLTVEFTNERTDLMPEQLLKGPPVRDSLEVTLP